MATRYRHLPMIFRYRSLHLGRLDDKDLEQARLSGLGLVHIVRTVQNVDEPQPDA